MVKPGPGAMIGCRGCLDDCIWLWVPRRPGSGVSTRLRVVVLRRSTVAIERSPPNRSPHTKPLVCNWREQICDTECAR